MELRARPPGRGFAVDAPDEAGPTADFMRLYETVDKGEFRRADNKECNRRVESSCGSRGGGSCQRQ